MPSRDRRCTEPRVLLTGKAALERRVQMASNRLERSIRQSRFMKTSWTKPGWLQKSRIACERANLISAEAQRLVCV